MNLSRLRGCYQRISAVVECPDQLGIVASMTNFLSSRKANITAVDQYLAPIFGDEVHSKDGPESKSRSRSSDVIKNFIMRFEFTFEDSKWTREDIESDMDELERCGLEPPSPAKGKNPKTLFLNPELCFQRAGT
mmetsp:Transcript_21172/g.86465  ORF Transcript_21172/g.86465 Transcript_21172/m.86465 type:complete len:134 (-) Transcript_21172:2299-2700(-)